MNKLIFLNILLNIYYISIALIEKKIFLLEEITNKMGDIMLKQKKHTNISINIRFQYILILFSSLFLFIISEYIFRGSLYNTFVWLFSNPISFFLNLFIVSLIILFFTSLFNGYRIGISITTTLVILFSVINRIKFNFRGIPLIAKDFYLNDELLTILDIVLTANTIKLIILSLLGITFIIFLIMNFPKLKLKTKDRVISSIISLVLLFTFININILKNISLYKGNIDCSKNGCILSFISSINKKPMNSSLEYIVNNIKDLNDNKTNNSSSSGIQPNIIIIMSEAFWDPSVMKAIQFSQSPTPNINKLKLTSIYGYLDAPTFGGGTANTEFELLTGNSIHFFNPGYMIYPNEIKKPIIALPSILKKQGYKCKAIHPFKNWYWNRREVYKHMGFDEFLSEEYLINPIYKGYFISDEHVTDLIIKELEMQNDPLFVFAVTMQNHGPFNDNRYDGYTKDIKVSGNVSSESLRTLQTYTQGIYDADKALGKLIDYCSDVSKPTVVLFFGDHLPFLGKNHRIYKETGYLSKSSVNHENDIKLTSVPFILWSNYKSKSQNLDLLNTSFMGPYLLEYAGLDMPNYFKFLQSLSKQLPVISRPYAIDKEKNVIRSNHEKYLSYHNDYLLVQKNILFEDKVFEDNFSSWIVKKNPNYNSSLKKISINEVIIRDGKAIVKGNNFYKDSLLYIDNKSYNYNYISANELHIRRKLLKRNSKLQLKLYDSKKNLLAVSNSYTF